MRVGIGYDRGGFSQKEVEDMEENERQLHIFNSEKGKIGITARHLIHTLQLPAYPNTDPEGIAYIIDATGHNKKDIEEEIDNVQWSRHLNNNTRA